MVGQTIKHYRITSELGHGGMGMVYKARDTHLDRDVALKFLPPHLSSDTDAKSRFIHEAKSASSLDHPNICTIYDIDETDEGQLFIAMAYYDGLTLKDRLESGPLLFDEAIDIATQIANALRRAHKADIVHRDIKPANIMVTDDGLVKLLDFGIAKLAGATVLTREGSTIGTVQYMSPEQARGETVNAHTDIWSLGVVLYEMLAGVRPFRGEYDQAVVYSILNTDPEPISDTKPDTPPSIEKIIERALEKNPAWRYQDAGEFFSALDQLSRDSTADVVTRPSAVIWLGRRQRRLLLRTASITAAVIFVVGLYFLLSGPTEARPVSVAVLPLMSDSDEPDSEWFSDGMTEAMITELAQIDNLRVISRNSVRRYKGTDKSLSQIAQELNVTYLLDGSVSRVGDTVAISVRLAEAHTNQYVWGDRYETDMADVLHTQSRIAGAVAMEIHGQVSPKVETRISQSRKINPAVYEAYLRGMHHINKFTPTDIEKGLDYLHEAVDLDPGDPYAYTGLATGYITVGHGAAATPDVWPLARAAADRAVTLDSTLAEARSASAIVKMYFYWDWEGAEKEFRTANALNPNLSLNHYHYAWLLVVFGRLEDALEEHILAEELDPLNAPLVAWTAEVYRLLGRFEEAALQAQKALDLGDVSGISELVLGWIYLNQERLDEAVQVHEQMVAKNPIWKGNLGSTYAAVGRIEDALRLASEIESSNPSLSESMLLVFLYAALGDVDKAFEWANREPHHGSLPWVALKDSPLYAMRDDPRFAQLVERMNLTGYDE